MDYTPTITPDLPGIGGQLKAEPSHFVVEEIPVYEAGGEGTHLFVSLTREGWTTRRVVEALAGLYDLSLIHISEPTRLLCLRVVQVWLGLRPAKAKTWMRSKIENQ